MSKDTKPTLDRACMRLLRKRSLENDIAFMVRESSGWDTRLTIRLFKYIADKKVAYDFLVEPVVKVDHFGLQLEYEVEKIKDLINSTTLRLYREANENHD